MQYVPPKRRRKLLPGYTSSHPGQAVRTSNASSLMESLQFEVVMAVDCGVTPCSLVNDVSEERAVFIFNVEGETYECDNTEVRGDQFFQKCW
jgi:hypothetical protein